MFFNIAGKNYLFLFPSKTHKKFPSQLDKIRWSGTTTMSSIVRQNGCGKRPQIWASVWGGGGGVVFIPLYFSKFSHPARLEMLENVSSSEHPLFCQPARFLWGTDKVRNRFVGCPWIHAQHRPSPPLDSVYAGTELIRASESVRNIGVWFDKTLLMKKHVNSVCKTAFCQLRHIATLIRRFLSYQHFEILIHAFVTSVDLIIVIRYYPVCLRQNLVQKTEHIIPILKNSTGCLLLVSELNLRS